MVSININIEKKHLFLISALMVFLMGFSFIIAFNSDFIGRDPSVIGHSSDEILVDVGGGVTKSLQNAITDGDLSNGGGLISVDTSDCTEDILSSSGSWDSVDCGVERVAVKFRSYTNNWGASDHWKMYVTCCKLKIS